MKKILILLLIVNMCFLSVYAANDDNGSDNSKTDVKKEYSKKSKDIKDKSNKQTSTEETSKSPDDMDMKGYSGNLPNIPKHFQIYQEQDVEPQYEVDENFNDPYKVKPAPKDNPSFVNIILKQEKTSQYVNEINELVFLIEKIQKTIEEEGSLQVFAARAYNLDKYVEFFRDKYQNKPESSYKSYKQVMQLNSEVQALAALRREKEVYSPYVVSSSNGNAFSDNNIELQNEYLLDNIKSTLIILQEAK